MIFATLEQNEETQNPITTIKYKFHIKKKKKIKKTKRTNLVLLKKYNFAAENKTH